MHTPTFSVIIPCLNEEKYLPKLLTNLEKQTYKNFEIIVVDGKSEDKTVKVAKSFTSKLTLNVISADKRNVSYQRNLGAKNCHGEVLVFFDADTKIPKHFFAELAQTFESESPDVVNSWIRTTSKLETDKAIATGINSIFEVSKFIGMPSCFGAFLAIKKSAFNKIRGFDEKMKFAEDSDILQRLVKENYKYVICRKTHYYYSLRRFKKEGVLNVIRKTAILNLNRSLKLNKFLNIPDYQMGGHVFENVKEGSSLAWLDQVFDNMRSNYQKNLKENRKFIRKLFKELR